MKDYNLSDKQEEEFQKLVEEKQQLILLALKKVNIAPKDYREFYGFALDGLLVSFLILEAGEIKKDDFDKFSFSTMKRKIIDEISRRNRQKIINFEEVEKTTLFSEPDFNIIKFEFFSSIDSKLTDQEKEFFSTFMKTNNFDKTILDRLVPKEDANNRQKFLFFISSIKTSTPILKTKATIIP